MQRFSSRSLSPLLPLYIHFFFSPPHSYHLLDINIRIDCGFTVHGRCEEHAYSSTTCGKIFFVYFISSLHILFILLFFFSSTCSIFNFSFPLAIYLRSHCRRNSESHQRTYTRRSSGMPNLLIFLFSFSFSFSLSSLSRFSIFANPYSQGLPPELQALLQSSGLSVPDLLANPQAVADVLYFHLHYVR